MSRIIPDKWLTVSEATDIMLEAVPGCVKVTRGDTYLRARNEHGATIIGVRVFDGTEHPLAKRGMVLDWTDRKERKQNQ